MRFANWLSEVCELTKKRPYFDTNVSALDLSRNLSVAMDKARFHVIRFDSD